MKDSYIMQKLEELKNKSEKVRTGLYIDKSLLDSVIEVAELHGLSVNETLVFFIENAVSHYTGSFTKTSNG